MTIGTFTRRIPASKSATVHPVRLNPDESQPVTPGRSMSGQAHSGRAMGSRFDLILRVRAQIDHGVYDVDRNLTACLPALLRDLVE